MNPIDKFLQEDMLITRPSVFIYVSKQDKDGVINRGIRISNGKIDAYLNRLPEDAPQYREFLANNYPVRLTLSKLRKIKNQIVKLHTKHMDGCDKLDLRDDETLHKLIKKYSEYLNCCYKDGIPLHELPHIELFFSGGEIPGFVCKVLDT